jgi:hypothetical protein
MFVKNLRRTLALAGSALVLTTLTSCGFDMGTDRVYTPAAGVNERDASVDVLNAVIVSSHDGSGTFIASFANNDPEPAAFSGLAGIDQTAVTVSGFTPVEIPADGFVNLANEGGVEVSGEFVQGDFVPMSVQFENGEQVEVDVPVVTNCGDFAGLDGPSDEAACEPEHETTEH